MDISIVSIQVKGALLPTSPIRFLTPYPISSPNPLGLYFPPQNLWLLLTPPEPIRLMFTPQPMQPYRCLGAEVEVSRIRNEGCCW